MMDSNLFPTNLALTRQNHLFRRQGHQLASIVMPKAGIGRPTLDVLALLQAQRIIGIDLALGL